MYKSNVQEPVKMPTLTVFQTQLAAIMELFTKAAVAKIEKLFGDYSSSAELQRKMCPQNQDETPKNKLMDRDCIKGQLVSIMEILTKEAMGKISTLVDQASTMRHLGLAQNENEGRVLQSSANRHSHSVRVQVDHEFRGAKEGEPISRCTISVRSEGGTTAAEEEEAPQQSVVMTSAEKAVESSAHTKERPPYEGQRREEERGTHLTPTEHQEEQDPRAHQPKVRHYRCHRVQSELEDFHPGE
ncbi:hypothetical protein AAFF_G00140460 [Aldrovandia affinis]|uniref:Uncharacterized protein n=1 Tax=Aldrovandia affinis TaxID=143900 RepID=A0AAD7TCC8_9TELE|nr:hypothetical protein AAFF_G00140460 [Aldrovandia affinis]